MKILFVTPALNERSGWGRLALETIKHLRAQGCEVEACSEGAEQGLPYPVHPLEPLTSRFSIFTLLANALRVRKKAKSFDVVHALDGWPWGVYAWAAVFGTRKAFFMDGVGTYSVAPLYAFGKKTLMWLLYKRVQKVFCISQYVMGELARAGAPKDKLAVVNFGMHVFPAVTEAQAAAVRETYRIAPKRHPILLTVGAIKDRKGQLDVMHAVQQLVEKHPHLLYIIAGSGNDQSYIARIKNYVQERGLEDALRVITDADDTALAALYALASVVVLASTNDAVTHHFEGFGQVIIEGYQFGVPAVGSRDCGIEDAIVDGVSGLLSNQRDPSDIAQKIQTVLERHSDFSQGARTTAQKFSWEQTATKYVGYYKKYVCKEA